MCDNSYVPQLPLFTEETFAAAADDNEEADTEAAVGHGAGFTQFTAMVLAFHLISKGFRTKCEARLPGQHRSEHRTGTAPSPDRRAPYLEAASNGDSSERH